MIKNILNLGDAALYCDFGSDVNQEINSNVIKYFYHIKKLNLKGITNLTPSYNKLIISYDLNIHSFLSLKKKIENIDNKNIKAKKILVKSVLLDANLHKQFKNHHFSKIDLHGLTVDQAHQKLIEYFSINYKKKNLFHIVVTGLGNKTNGEEFFTGKIRRQFPFWLDTEKFQFMIKSYSPCKIQHGGLGAFYIKLRSKE